MHRQKFIYIRGVLEGHLKANDRLMEQKTQKAKKQIHDKLINELYSGFSMGIKKGIYHSAKGIKR